MDGTKFWANVKDRMGYMRMTDLANASGLNAGNLRALRARGAVPKADQSVRIARALNCKVDDLFAEAVPV